MNTAMNSDMKNNGSGSANGFTHVNPVDKLEAAFMVLQNDFILFTDLKIILCNISY